jgi:exonuclease VII small subunit
MSSDLIIPFPPAKLARAAWARVIGLLLLGIVAAAALGFYGYQLHRLNGAVNSYQQAVFQYQMRTEAIDRLSDMEAAFNRYLLDGNSANTGLLQADKQRIEQLAQTNADAQNDKVTQSLVATEQKWYGQAVQPLIEERRKLAAGQGLPEDFLAKYRAAPQDLQIINFEMTAESAYHQAQQSLQQAEDQLRWRWIVFPLAGLLMLSVIWLAIGAMRNVKHLKYAAENPEEDDDDEPEPQDHNVGTK